MEGSLVKNPFRNLQKAFIIITVLKNAQDAGEEEMI